ncbi:hypothetical protein [Streptomyces sp. NBC_00038]|uniref:hypothetical protein n=1 Tax=Streptomyces sp. NBC_00038 TaxID=2903615 RepID=UPI00224FB5DB|nr:hypothetical protein [Streptomyces sp. NBC_00038]MCX5557889.1 hypothetical protein [Streptomyces sp. NBC_00038]
MGYPQEFFVADGSFRDLCILDADLADWQRLLSSLSLLKWPVFFSTTYSREPSELPGSARELFEELALDSEESATLAIQADGIWFTCYFFEVEEIEFTFDPVDVVDEASFGMLERFMKWLGDTCGKEVRMTMEGTDHPSMPALFTYSPPIQR